MPSEDKLNNVNQDLVCETPVESEDSNFFSEYNGRTYFFCSSECKRKFDDHPDYFIHKKAKENLETANQVEAH
jgi:YHS domain-containing protein